MKPLKPEVEKYLRDLGINIEMSNSVCFYSYSYYFIVNSSLL